MIILLIVVAYLLLVGMLNGSKGRVNWFIFNLLPIVLAGALLFEQFDITLK